MSSTPEAGLSVQSDAGLNEQSGAYDALADLFLGEPKPLTMGAPVRVARPVEPRKTPVDVMLLGHLPVMASAWAMQYARQAASEAAGAVGVLRLRGGEITLEVVGGPDRGEAEPMPHLPSAIGAAMAVVHRWLVRVDDIAEPLVAQLPAVDAITVLTGADEAAVVSAYQMIKNLGPGGPDLRLALMGAAPERALESAERIAKTASSHLGRKITVSASIARISGGRTSLLHRGPLLSDTVEALAGILDQIRSGRMPQAPVAPRPAPAPVAPLSRPEAAKPVPAASSVAGVSHLGLESLPFGCPVMESASLGTNGDGRLHIVLPAGDDPTDAARRLGAVSAWAKQHAELIRLASGACGKSVDLRMDPGLHMTTDRPKLIRPLLDGPVKLHLVAAVTVEGKQGWFVTELN
jgi:hypothetical protein